MLPHAQLRHHLIHRPDGRSQLPARGGQHHPVVHIPHIKATERRHALIQRLQIERAHQRRQWTAQRDPSFDGRIVAPIRHDPGEVLPDQRQDGRVFHLVPDEIEEDPVVDAGVVAFHIGAKDKGLPGHLPRHGPHGTLDTMKRGRESFLERLARN